MHTSCVSKNANSLHTSAESHCYMTVTTVMFNVTCMTVVLLEYNHDTALHMSIVNSLHTSRVYVTEIIVMWNRSRMSSLTSTEGHTVWE